MISLTDVAASWSGLSARTRRWTTLGVGGAALLGGMYVLMPDDAPKQRAQSTRQATVEAILTDKDPRSTSMDSMAARIKQLEERLTGATAELERLREDAGRRERRTEKPEGADASQAQRAALEMQIGELQRKVNELTAATTARDGAGAGRTGGAIAPTATVPPRPTIAGGSQRPTAGDLYGGGNGGPISANPAAGGALAAPPDRSAPSGQGLKAGEIRTISASAEPAALSAGQGAGKNEDALGDYIPSGSILGAHFITGMDAATSNSARDQPLPALLRVNHAAILPNRFRSDIRECFMLVAGYGDMSSERAMLRGETLSCITKDGKPIEASLSAYVAGEDGKAGVRGRMISKEGQVIGRALMAGFLEGASKAFDVKPVPILSTNPGGRTQYQDNFAGVDSLKSASLGGAGSALEQVAKYYIDMAKNIFPVIEIDAGRQVDLIVTRGVSLKFGAHPASTPVAAAPGARSSGAPGQQGQGKGPLSFLDQFNPGAGQAR